MNNRSIHITNNINLKNNYYAKVEIPKITLKKELFPKESAKNNVDQNITILKESELPNIENSILILAAHSGTGEHAYFNDLYKLKKHDEIIIYYKNYKYFYEIDNIYEEIKSGKIHITKMKNQNQIILTTCSISNNNKQLVISGYLKNKERET